MFLLPFTIAPPISLPRCMVSGRKRQKKRKENLKEIDRWIETKKCLSRAYFRLLLSLLARFNPLHNKRFSQPYSSSLVIYSRCQYGTENWIRFCAPFRCKSSTQNEVRVKVMWMLKYNLNAICEFKRSSNMSRGRQTKGISTQDAALLAVVTERRRRGEGEGTTNLLLFLSDITDPEKNLLNLFSASFSLCCREMPWKYLKL